MDLTEQPSRGSAPDQNPQVDGSESRDLVADWAATLALAGFSVLVLVLATPLASFSTFGPGPGFFAQYLGATLLGLVMVHLAMLGLRSFRSPGRQVRSAGATEAGRSGAVSRGDVVRFAVMAATLFAYPPLLRPIGFVAATAGLSWVLLTMLGRSPIRAAIEALASVVVLKLVFSRLLDVPLPSTPIEALAAIGL